MQDAPPEEHTRVVEYIEAAVTGCRRVVLDGYLDGPVRGYHRQRCSDTVVKSACDRCQADWQDYEPYIDTVSCIAADAEMVDRDAVVPPT